MVDEVSAVGDSEYQEWSREFSVATTADRALPLDSGSIMVNGFLAEAPSTDPSRRTKTRFSRAHPTLETDTLISCEAKF